MNPNMPTCHKKTNTNPSSQPQLKEYFPKADQTLITRSIFSNCEVLSVIEKSFICVHYEGEIFLVDQHAACEKLLYMEKYNEFQTHIRPSKKVTKKYSIPNMFYRILIEKRELIEKLGWEFYFGERSGSFTIINVVKEPFVLTETIGEDELVYYLELFYDGEDVEVGREYEEEQEYEQEQIAISSNKMIIKKEPKELEQHQHLPPTPTNILKTIDLSQREKELIAEFSCHHSYRFGQELSIKKAEEIVRKLGLIEAPFNCPHSRLLISYYGRVKELGLGLVVE